MNARYFMLGLFFLVPCDTRGQIPWPVAFQENCGHPIYGTLGEPRGVVGQSGAHLHDGVDIGNPEDYPVFAVSSGPVSTGYLNGNFNDKWVRVGNYSYAHLKNFSGAVRAAKNTRQRLLVGALLGYTNWRGHVHFKSGPSGGETNPLAQLTGYAYNGPPTVSTVSPPYLLDDTSRQHLNQQSDGSFVLNSDSVDLIVDASDAQSCGSGDVGLYTVGYSVQENSTGKILARNFGVTFSALPTKDPTNVYLDGSAGGESQTTNKFLYVANNTIVAREPIDTSSYASGSYTFAFTGCDILSNCVTKSLIAVKLGLTGDWAGTATVTENGSTETIQVSASIRQTANSITGTVVFTGPGDVPQIHTETLQVNGLNFSLPATSDGAAVNITGRFTPDRLIMSGSGADPDESASGSGSQTLSPDGRHISGKASGTVRPCNCSVLVTWDVYKQ